MTQQVNRTLALAAGLLMVAAVANAATYYTVTDLGNLSGPIGSAMNISNDGRVAGLATLSSGHFHAVYWNGGVTDLGTLGSDNESSAYGVNAAGQVVGVSYNYGDLSPHAFLWQAGVLTSIGSFLPHEINAAGAIAGSVTVFNGASLWVEHPCTWSAGVLTELPTLGGHAGQGMAINSAGQVAGQSFLADNKTVRGCVWVGGTVHDLGSLAGTAAAQSGAADLSDNGQVVGWSTTAAGVPHATLFQIDNTGAVLSRTDLGAFAGSNSYAHGVNNAGEVVGVADSRGFAWQAGTMTDLSASVAAGSGWFISNAAAVNDSGVIVGEGVRFGFPRAVMLTPATCLKGDVTGDGKIDGEDINVFVQVLFVGGTAQQTCAADVAIPFSGAVDTVDVAAFVQCVLAGGCG